MSWGAAATIGGSVISGLFGRSGQSSANKTNIRLAKENREFQRDMSNTAHTRSAIDLKRAGLNRILALGKPASSPAGNVATVSNENEALANSAANIASILANIKKTNAETKFIQNKTAISDTAASIGGTVNKGVTSVKDYIDPLGKQLGMKVFDLEQAVKETGTKLRGEVTSTAKDMKKGIENFFTPEKKEDIPQSEATKRFLRDLKKRKSQGNF